MIEDTSLQLFQQRVIGQIPRILTGAPESVRVQKLGRNLALAYMAGTSSQQAYSEFKNAGATDAVAGLGMLSVMGGMYGLMNMDYFRNFLFKGTYLDQNPAKKAVKDLGEKLTDTEKKETEDLIADLKKALEGTDIDAIKDKTKALNDKAMALATKVYEEAAKTAEANKNNNSSDKNDGAEEAEFVNKD